MFFLLLKFLYISRQDSSPSTPKKSISNAVMMEAHGKTRFTDKNALHVQLLVATPIPWRTGERGAMGCLAAGKVFSPEYTPECLGEQRTACHLTQRTRMTGHCTGKEMKEKDRCVDDTIISLSNWHIIRVSNSLLQINSSSTGHRTM